MRKLKRWFDGRLLKTAAGLLVQILLMGAFFLWLDQNSVMHLVLRIVSYVAVLVIVNQRMETSLQLMCCVLILLFPWIGGIFYFLLKVKKEPGIHHTPLQNEKMPKVLNYAVNHAQGKYCMQSTGEYFSCMEDLKPIYLNELKKAKHTIFMEYFIVSEGLFLTEILEILIERMESGVEVYWMVDDIGCIRTLPEQWVEKMRISGIHVHVYEPLSMKLSWKANTRDHRKMTIIDDDCAFVGGNNLADEYFNCIKKFGYWKDTAVLLRGDAAMHCGQLFRHFWNQHASCIIKEPVSSFTPRQPYDGIVVPFVSDAEKMERAGMNVHLLMIQNARVSLDIQTPYLICNDEIKHALMLASQSGVHVRIIVPHVPDRKLIHEMTRSNYLELINSGIRIFEYAPGFIHSKVMVSDDVGLCSTINMDNRSYLHHHECGVLFYECSIIEKMKQDMQNTISQSIEIQRTDCQKPSLLSKGVRMMMKLWEPLL